MEPEGGAGYALRQELDLGRVLPMAAGDHRTPSRPAAELAGAPVRRIFVGGQTGASLVDLRRLEGALRGRRVAADLTIQIAPSSLSTFQEALKSGVAGSLVESGAEILPPGAPPGGQAKLSLWTSLLPPAGWDGFGVSSATAAAAALSGEFRHPEKLHEPGGRDSKLSSRKPSI